MVVRNNHLLIPNLYRISINPSVSVNATITRRINALWRMVRNNHLLLPSCYRLSTRLSLLTAQSQDESTLNDMPVRCQPVRVSLRAAEGRGRSSARRWLVAKAPARLATFTSQSQPSAGLHLPPRLRPISSRPSAPFTEPRLRYATPSYLQSHRRGI